MSYQILLDVSSLMYRGFFALPKSLADSEGQPVNAVHGYLDMTTRLLTERRPDEVVHVYDHDWRPTPRVAAYPAYKADRPDDPPELPPQFALLRQVLDGFGLPQAEAPGWEADDAIATLGARAARDDRVDVVTGDRDLIALVRDPTIRVLFTVRGVSELRVYDEAEVESHYGVSPARYSDLAILRGDASDGLPGVKGVGEKTARTLVNAYAGLDALLDDAQAQPPQQSVLARSPRLAASLTDAAPYLAAVREVVPMRTEVELREWRGTRDDARLDSLADTGGLRGPVRRLRDALGH